MKFNPCLRLLALSAAIIAVFALLPGCETESATTPITISPMSATLRVNQSIVFTASGGYDYKWKVSNPELGTLNAKYGSSVIYTCRSASGTNTVTVTGYIQGQSTGGGTNSTSTTSTATEWQTADAVVIPYSVASSTAQ